MGNKIKNLANIELGGMLFNVELNGGTKSENYDIHIQNSNMSICLKDYEFSRFVTAILVANKRMKRFKENNEQSSSF